MISYEKFKQLKEMQAIGTSKVEVGKRLSIDRRNIEIFWNKSEADYFKLDQGKIHYSYTRLSCS